MKLAEFQLKLKQKGLQAFLVTHDNMFLNQDILDSENKILELTGFTGSAGVLLVTPSKAWLLVDGRYAIQARLETKRKKITVVDSQSFTVDVVTLCVKNKINTLCYNPWCVSASDVSFYAGKIGLKPAEEVLPSVPVPPSKVYQHDLKYTKLSAQEKCESVAKSLLQGADALLISAADDVSWLCNLRSVLLPYTPVLRAYALLNRQGGVQLFADDVQGFGIILPMKALEKVLERYKGKTILYNPDTTPQKMLDMVKGINFKRLFFNPLLNMKATKNKTELKGYQEAHLQDGIAVTKFLYWLHQQKKNKLTELDVVEKLHEFRAKRPLFVSESFATIAATGAHAAIVHYQPSKKTNEPLEKNSVLLLDSGGQYLNGTTDVTRTIAIGKPSKQMITDFTLVLKAHIRLATAVFPENASGRALDALARSVLWQEGKDYRHGTGHGVGYFLNVHEGPFNMNLNTTAHIKANYVTSIEPGYYLENKYGIRLENLVYSVPAKQKGFLKFENLTLIPIDKKLINPYLLSDGEREWLDNYHQNVWRCLAPYMDKNEAEWLKAACSPLI